MGPHIRADRPIRFGALRVCTAGYPTTFHTIPPGQADAHSSYYRSGNRNHPGIGDGRGLSVQYPTYQVFPDDDGRGKRGTGCDLWVLQAHARDVQWDGSHGRGPRLTQWYSITFRAMM